MSNTKEQLQSLATSMRKELKIDAVPGWEMEENVEKMPCPSLQLTTKTGGFYRGRIHHIVGASHAHKSTFVLQTCAMDNEPWAILDVEGTMTEDYLDALGIDRDRILYIPLYGESLEKCAEVSKEVVQHGFLGGFMLDSLNALQPKKKSDESVDAHNIGLYAKMLNTHIKYMNGMFKRNNIAAFYLDQFRTDVGKMMGDKRIPSAGAVMKYYNSMELWLTRAKDGQNKDENGFPLEVVNITCKKDKLNPLWGKLSIPLMGSRGVGFDKVGDMVAMVDETPFLTKDGNSFYSSISGEEKLGVGKKQVRQFFTDNPEMFVQIREQMVIYLDESNLIEKE